MGTTFSSIHIFTDEKIHGCCSFSEGWQTYYPDEEPEDPVEFRKLAKKFSKSTEAPVLWFYIFDSESVWFEFYKSGKRVAAYSQAELTGSKNLYGIPALVGYEDGQKRRLSRILSCADTEYQVELLEEYFGVCLLPVPDEPAEALRRTRSDRLYLELLAQEKALTGKQSPIRAELVLEQTGKLFEKRFGEWNGGTVRPHHYYFGYDTAASVFKDGNLRPVRFRGGELVFITQEEFDAVPKLSRGDFEKDERFAVEFFPVFKMHFTDKAPEALWGKTLTPPRGYYPGWIDEKGRIILTDERGGLAVVDDSLKIIAKMRVKGIPVDYIDGHILTEGQQSGFAYDYNASEKVRVYRICEKQV